MVGDQPRIRVARDCDTFVTTRIPNNRKLVLDVIQIFAFDIYAVYQQAIAI